MALGKFFKSLLGGAFGDGAPRPSDPIDYEGFVIEAAPIHEDGKFRSAGYISGDVDGENVRVHFVRADLSADLGSAVKHSVSKARQIIDEQGKGLLKKTQL